MAKTAKGLVEYCKAQVGKPYWWGTFGNTATKELLAYKRSQYPNQYVASDFTMQFGQRVHDCVGLIKGYRWSDSPLAEPKYNASQDVSVSGLWKQCSKTGTISTMPETPGTCVFMATMGHVGVYIGNGKVVEARGHAYGVQETSLAERDWALWGQPNWLVYDEVVDSVVNYYEQLSSRMKLYVGQLPGVAKGAYGPYVLFIQLCLNQYGLAGLELDMQFGDKTKEAVKLWQKNHSLETDGIVGKQTWASFMLAR